MDLLSWLLSLLLVFFAGAGAALVHSGLRANREGRRIAREWARVPGRVVAERVSTDGEGATARQVGVRFTVNGRAFQVWDAPNLSPLGTDVEVLCDPAAPARAMLAENAPVHGRGLVVFGAAVLALSVPFALLLGAFVVGR